MTSETGYFIDWNGNARSVQDAGGNFTVEVDMPSKYVALYSKGGTLMHEAIKGIKTAQIGEVAGNE